MLAMIAAAIPDLDGLGIIFGPVAYWRYHHLLCHNILFGLLISAALAFLCQKRLKVFSFFLALFHLHLLMDSFGSGEEWTIRYLWPLSNWEFVNPYGWEFFTWQNISIGVLFVIWMIALVFIKHRTFFECCAPKLDRQFVDLTDRYTAELVKSKKAANTKSF